MNRPAAPVVLLLCGLLALSACGSGKSTAPRAGDTGPAASAAAGPAVSGSQESVRIGVYTQVFATPIPTAPVPARVIEGFRKAQILWERSDIAMHLVAPVTDYVTAVALTHLIVAVTADKTRDVVPAGTDRFFMTRVTAITDRSATLTTCDDGSKFREQNPRTGKGDPAYTPHADQAYDFEIWHMVKRSGHWAIADFSLAFLPDPRAEPCQP